MQQARQLSLFDRPPSLRMGSEPAVRFYATIDADSIRDYMPADVSYLLPASSWARGMARKMVTSADPDAFFDASGIPPVRLPAHVQHVAADCGGFVATFKWGAYPYHSAQYVRWLESIGPALDWAAMMDLCMEEEIVSGDAGLIRERQDWTTAMAERFWQSYCDAPWAFVPTLQGWSVADYVRHAEAMAPLITEMQSFYAERPAMTDDESEPELWERHSRNLIDFRVGIGTLCRRASVAQIRQIVAAVSEVLPNVSFHLWGVKLGALKAGLPTSVVSVDSAAWNGRFGRDLERQKGSGLTQREYSYTVALPSYLEKVAAALAS